MGPSQSPAEPQGPAAPRGPQAKQAEPSIFLQEQPGTPSCHPSTSDTPQGKGPLHTCPTSAQRGWHCWVQGWFLILQPQWVSLCQSHLCFQRLDPGTKFSSVPRHGGAMGVPMGGSLHMSWHMQDTAKRAALGTPRSAPLTGGQQRNRPQNTGFQFLDTMGAAKPPKSNSGDRHRAGRGLQGSSVPDGAGPQWQGNN